MGVDHDVVITRIFFAPFFLLNLSVIFFSFSVLRQHLQVNNLWINHLSEADSTSEDLNGDQPKSIEEKDLQQKLPYCHH